jgi:hypothetical protein
LINNNWDAGGYPNIGTNAKQKTYAAPRRRIDKLLALGRVE